MKAFQIAAVEDTAFAADVEIWDQNVVILFGRGGPHVPFHADAHRLSQFCSPLGHGEQAKLTFCLEENMKSV